MEESEQFDSAVDSELGDGVYPETVAALVDLAADVTSAFASWNLPQERREQLYARAWQRFERRSRLHVLQDRLHLDRRGMAILGGAAVVVAAIGVGVAVAHERRAHAAA